MKTSARKRAYMLAYYQRTRAARLATGQRYYRAHRPQRLAYQHAYNARHSLWQPDLLRRGWWAAGDPCRIVTPARATLAPHIPGPAILLAGRWVAWVSGRQVQP